MDQAPVAPAPASVAPAGPAPVAVADAPAVPAAAAPVEDGALPRTTLRTLRRLREAGDDGTTLDDLGVLVGYQPATVARHIDTLAAHRLVHHRDGLWYAVPVPV